jgi:hypothetical protein
MHTISAILVLTLPFFTKAQDYGGSPAPKSSSASAAAASAAPAAGVHVVDVGKTGFNFMPSSLTAKVGDQVEFHFDNPTHSVGQSTFNSPCAPSGPTGFWSGFPNDLVCLLPLLQRDSPTRHPDDDVLMYNTSQNRSRSRSTAQIRSGSTVPKSATARAVWSVSSILRMRDILFFRTMR